MTHIFCSLMIQNVGLFAPVFTAGTITWYGSDPFQMTVSTHASASTELLRIVTCS